MDVCRGCERVKVCGFVDVQYARKEGRENALEFEVQRFSMVCLLTSLSVVARAMRLLVRAAGTSEARSDWVKAGRSCGRHFPRSSKCHFGSV